MPNEVFAQHHILLNYREQPHRVINIRNGIERSFLFHHHEVVVTPAGVSSGWQWFDQSRCIVITLEPVLLAQFAQREIGMQLTPQQISDQPLFHDPELCHSAMMLFESLQQTADSHLGRQGSALVFESFARVFLVKLLHRFGQIAPHFSGE